MKPVFVTIACLAALGFAWPAAAAGSVRDQVTVTLVPDASGRFDSARVEEQIWFDGVDRTDRTIVRHVRGWMPGQAVAIGPDGMPLPVQQDAQAQTLRVTVPEGMDGPMTLRFAVDDAIAESARGNQLDLGWLRWQDRPVTTQQVTVLFPQGFVPQDLVSTWDDIPGARPSRRVALGVEAVQIETEGQPARPLVLAFTPKLVSVAVVWYMLVAAAALLTLLTAVRLLRIPGVGSRDRRDPTPAEIAYLLGGEDAALLVAHLDLELQQRLIRGGRHFHTRSQDGVGEGFQQLLLAYYQEPRPFDRLFLSDSTHRQAFIDALLLSLQQKGIWRDLHPRTDAALDLVGYWAACTLPVGLAVLGLDAWSQLWTHAWLEAGAVLAFLYLGIPLTLLRGGSLTAVGRERLRKYHILLSEGMHNRDPQNGPRLQLAYGAALVGLPWLRGALPDEQVELYQSAGTVHEEHEPISLSLEDLVAPIGAPSRS
jgi:uncharacterized protein (TIGR04222 family)